MSVPLVSAVAVTVQYGTQVVLDAATFALNESERIGLLGRNGAGKSTFLELVAGKRRPDRGEVVRRRELSIGYMPQRLGLDDGLTVFENVRLGARHITNLVAQYENGAADSALSAQLLDQINQSDGWNLDYRIRSILQNVHAPDPERVTNTLSGGEMRRVALCQALISNPELLILDEPTNHLDIEAIEWLENFLEHYSGTCLFVTHDRYFLDRVATGIVEIAEGSLQRFPGNYTDYLIARAEQQAVAEQQEKKRRRFMERELDWVRRSPSARRTKSLHRVNRYFELAAQNGKSPELDVEFILPASPRLSERVLELRAVSYAVDNRTLFANLSLDLPPGEKLGVVGRNGSGKSTLLRLMSGEIAPAAGAVELGPRSQVNYMDQNRLSLDDGKTVWQEVGQGSEFVQLADATISLRSYLRRLLFSEERVNTRIADLSGGERSRVLLAKLLLKGGNVLLLDEPTNDLDLPTLRLFEEALIVFPGTVVVVSHDRFFLNRVCSSTLALEGNGAVRHCHGNYDYYLEKKAEVASAHATVQEGTTRATGSDRAAIRRLTWKEQRELESLEGEIALAEQDLTKLEALFAEPDFYRKYGPRRQELEAQLAAARRLVEIRYQRWVELEDRQSGRE